LSGRWFVALRGGQPVGVFSERGGGLAREAGKLFAGCTLAERLETARQLRPDGQSEWHRQLCGARAVERRHQLPRRRRHRAAAAW
nr:hypothetical protein [Tanacetum cinerariifolium]